jgi:MerR family copper efflux transcriptional regulator
MVGRSRGGEKMNIGQAAAAADMNAKMVRHYESIGLIDRAQRSESGYRQYNDSDIHTLRFIKRSRRLGFSMRDIRLSLTIWHDRQRPSSEVKALAISHIGELDAKIAELQGMRDTLHHLAKYCQGDHRPNCPILNDLEAAIPLW